MTVVCLVSAAVLTLALTLTQHLLSNLQNLIDHVKAMEKASGFCDLLTGLHAFSCNMHPAA